VSLGVASTDGTESSGKELYQRADEKLYAAKQGGRNAVVG
jgi:PleD family two-component response regulator